MSWLDYWRRPETQAGMTGFAGGFGAGARGGYGTFADALTSAVMGFEGAQQDYFARQQEEERRRMMLEEREMRLQALREEQERASRGEAASSVMAEWMRGGIEAPFVASPLPPREAFADPAAEVSFLQRDQEMQERERQRRMLQERVSAVLGENATGDLETDLNILQRVIPDRLKPDEPESLTPYQAAQLSLSRERFEFDQQKEEEERARAEARERQWRVEQLMRLEGDEDLRAPEYDPSLSPEDQALADARRYRSEALLREIGGGLPKLPPRSAGTPGSHPVAPDLPSRASGESSPTGATPAPKPAQPPRQTKTLEQAQTEAVALLADAPPEVQSEVAAEIERMVASGMTPAKALFELRAALARRRR